MRRLSKKITRKVENFYVQSTKTFYKTLTAARQVAVNDEDILVSLASRELRPMVKLNEFIK